MSAIFSWSALWWVLLILYVPVCIGLIVFVLLQKGKGSGFAGAFGVGPGSETVFGPRLTQSLPVRITYTLATLFMVLALGLTLVYGRSVRGAAPETVEVVPPEQLIEEQFQPLVNLGVGGPAEDAEEEGEPDSPSLDAPAEAPEGLDPATDAVAPTAETEPDTADRAPAEEPAAAEDAPASDAN